MTRDELLRLARESGFDVRDKSIRTIHSTGAWVEINNKLQKFAIFASAKERVARIEAQQRLADMQELAAKSGLAHRKDVQAAVSDAMKRMQAGEKLSYTDKDVELIMLGWQSELQKAVADERAKTEQLQTRCEILNGWLENHYTEAKRVLMAENEVCATLCDQIAELGGSAKDCSNAIRARGTP